MTLTTKKNAEFSRFYKFFARKNNKLITFFLLFFGLIMINFVGCCPYSFTGASTPEHLKSIAIPVADDRSGSGEPGLRELLTSKLNQKFIEDNTLRVTDRTSANSILECVISSVTDLPFVVRPGETETVSLRKLTISVKVTYKDLVKRKIVFEKQFSQFGSYSPGNLTERDAAKEEAINKITEDILLDTVSGW